jgi:pilus assembly protein CpaE
MLLTLGTDAGTADKVKIILNRVGSETDISLKKAEETIGKPIYWQVPNDPKVMVESRNAGEPLVKFAPKCKVQQSIAGLAQALCGKELQPAGKEKSNRWGALFSRR